ncbi:hypothetical protein GPALN_006868 [Globodera pallida]|nr:hypothetical protein GPALN_006868 [Globodera pallida]
MTQKTFDATSWWWYFAKIDENRVKCKFCEWERDYDSKKGTNSLKNHMEKEHPDKLREKVEAKQKKEEAEKTRKRAREQQPSLLQHGFSSSCPSDQPSSNKRRADSPASTYAIFSEFSMNDVEVRWNSTFTMLRSLLENRRALAILSQEENLPKFSENEWDLMQAIVQVLEPIYLATKEIESRRCTISSCVPIMKFFEPYLTDSHRKIFEQAAAELVTPILESSENAEPQHSPVHLGGIFALMEAQQNEDMTFIQPNVELNRTTSPNLDPRTQAIVQVAEYLAEQPQPFSTDPFLYWKTKEAQGKWPLLCGVARKFMSAPCGSVVGSHPWCQWRFCRHIGRAKSHHHGGI